MRQQKKPTAPTPAPPVVAPSVADIGRLIGAAVAARRSLGRLGENGEKASAFALTFSRQAALEDLAMTLRARTLADAAVHLVCAFRAGLQFDEFAENSVDREECLHKIRSGLANAAPIVAAAAGLALSDIGGAEIITFRDGEFPDLPMAVRGGVF